jgi:hypothetical protein
LKEHVNKVLNAVVRDIRCETGEVRRKHVEGTNSRASGTAEARS